MTPASQLAPIDRFRRLPRRMRAEVYAALRRLGPGALASQRYKWREFLGRPDQVVTEVPLGKDLVVFGGIRGTGKTEAAIQFWVGEILAGRSKLPRMFAATEADVGGVLATRIRAALPPHMRPEWVPSTREAQAGLLRFPNDVIARGFAAAAPEGCVSWEGDLDLYDDLAKWGHNAERAWFHARASCRKGRGLGVLATTMRGTILLRRYLKGDLAGVLLRKPPSGAANDFNLSAGLRQRREKELGDSELYGLDMDDEFDENDGSPFAGISWPGLRVEVPEPLTEIAVWIDPATSSAAHSCEVGVVAVGIDARGVVYGLADRSKVMSADEWPKVAHDLHDEMTLSYRGVPIHLGIEINVGGNMGPELLRQEERLRRSALGKPPVSVIEVRTEKAAKSKVQRAGPVARLARVGQFKMLPNMTKVENQLSNLRDDGGKSDRADAAVHAVIDVAKLAEQDDDGADQFAIARAMNETLSGKRPKEAPPEPGPMKVEGALPGDARHPGPAKLAARTPNWRSRTVF